MCCACQYETQHRSARHPILLVPRRDSPAKVGAHSGWDLHLLDFCFVCLWKSFVGNHRLAHPPDIAQPDITMLVYVRVASTCNLLTWISSLRKLLYYKHFVGSSSASLWNLLFRHGAICAALYVVPETLDQKVNGNLHLHQILQPLIALKGDKLRIL